MVTLTEAVANSAARALIRSIETRLFPGFIDDHQTLPDVVSGRVICKSYIRNLLLKGVSGLLSREFFKAVNQEMLPVIERSIAIANLKREIERFRHNFQQAKIALRQSLEHGGRLTLDSVSEAFDAHRDVSRFDTHVKLRFVDLLREAGFEGLAQKVERDDFLQVTDDVAFSQMMEEVQSVHTRLKETITIFVERNCGPISVLDEWGDASLLEHLETLKEYTQAIVSDPVTADLECSAVRGLKFWSGRLETEFAQAVQEKLPCFETASLACELLAFWNEMVETLRAGSAERQAACVPAFGCPAALMWYVEDPADILARFAADLKSLDIDGADDFAKMVENGKLGDITQDLLRKLHDGLELKAQELSRHLQELIAIGRARATGYKPSEPAAP